METNTVLLAFALTLFAGLSTGVGSLVALFIKQTNTRFLCIALGFSAGVMLYVSFVELLAEARVALDSHFATGLGGWLTLAGFFGGIFIIAVIDKFIPSEYNPHELHYCNPNEHGAAASCTPKAQNGTQNMEKLSRTGFFTAIAIAIHNFPEGMATFTAAVSDPTLGIAIAVAVAIHNVPEGIAVAVPIFYATGSRKNAFMHSFLSGLAEPLGAIVGFIILLPFFTPAVMGFVFAIVAGIMVYISLDELLPAAEEYGEHHLCIYGCIAGMGLMAVSLLLLG